MFFPFVFIVLLSFRTTFASSWHNRSTTILTPRSEAPSGTSWSRLQGSVSRLFPANSWDHDPSDLSHLMPTIDNKLFYIKSPGSSRLPLIFDIPQSLTNFRWTSLRPLRFSQYELRSSRRCARTISVCRVGQMLHEQLNNKIRNLRCFQARAKRVGYTEE